MDNNVQPHKWWQFKKMTRKDYGRLFWLTIVLAFIRQAAPTVALLGIFLDILITAGMISGIIWIVLGFRKGDSTKK